MTIAEKKNEMKKDEDLKRKFIERRKIDSFRIIIRHILIVAKKDFLTQNFLFDSDDDLDDSEMRKNEIEKSISTA